VIGTAAALWDAFVTAAQREHQKASARDPSLFPHYTEGSSWCLLPVDQLSRWIEGDVYEHGNWTAGFSVGVTWLKSLGTGARLVDDATQRRLKLLAARANDSTTHDLGFLFYPSFVLGTQLGLVAAGDATPAFRAAKMMGQRFNDRGGFVQAFGAIGDHRSAGTSTIDTMLNLPLLWWATARGSDLALYDVARRHARTSARLFFRPDGSTYHLNRFDAVSGALHARGTFQGADAESCWSRGQAWAISGFAWAYAATGESELLDVAETAANYFCSRLPEDGIAPWDFSDGSPDPTLDASASAIAALGTLILAQIHPDPASRSRYSRTGEDLTFKLSPYLNRNADRDGILLHSCYSKPHRLGMDGATAWGDFFLGLAVGVVAGKVSVDDVFGFPAEVGGRGHPLAERTGS